MTKCGVSSRGTDKDSKYYCIYTSLAPLYKQQMDLGAVMDTIPHLDYDSWIQQT